MHGRMPWPVIRYLHMEVLLLLIPRVDEITAAEIDKIFFEIIIAPGFTESALEILKQKKNRIILLRKDSDKKQLRIQITA